MVSGQNYGGDLAARHRVDSDHRHRDFPRGHAAGEANINHRWTQMTQIKPKTENRNPKEIRSPKTELRDYCKIARSLFKNGAKIISDFGLPSDFADSDFGFS